MEIAYQTKDYQVVVTPREWREEPPLVDLKRSLCEYSILSKRYGTIEAGMNALPSAIMTCNTLQEALDECTGKSTEVNHGNVVGFPGKDRIE